MIGLHANKGITFDLAAIRQATACQRPRFRAAVGYGGAAGSFRADAWIFVDGQLAWKKTDLANESGALPINILLGADARFLTLMATDAGNEVSHDQVFFGDPLLIHEPEKALGQNDAQTERRRELMAERDALQSKVDRVRGGREIAKVYAAVSKTPPPIRVLRRGDTESPGREVAAGALSCLPDVAAEFAPADASEADDAAAFGG